MAVVLDDNFLTDLGLNLPVAEKEAFLEFVYDTLETRVGQRLADAMSEEQLDEFETFLPDEETGEGGDENGAMKWLETNFPDYPKVVAEELAKLREEIKRDADKIRAGLQR